MRRKFIPVEVDFKQEKVYMADVRRIYKLKRKKMIKIPIFTEIQFLSDDLGKGKEDSHTS